MDKLRVGFIGAGRISDLHAIEYLNDPRAEIYALCDINPDNAQSRANAWEIPKKRVFSDYHDLLNVAEIDLVEILTPHNLHYEHTLAAASAGKHISLQKPMAIDLKQADEMIAATERAGVIFKVFENFIFYPPVIRARELIDTGEIGEPLTIRIKSNAANSPNAWDVPQDAWTWRFDRSSCGGGPLVFDDGHHKFSLAWFFMGNIAEEVHAWIGQFPSSWGGKPGFLDSPAIVSFKFPGNRIGSLEVVYSPELIIDTEHYAQDDRIEITGTKGVIWITRGHGKMMDIPPVIMYKDMKTYTFSDMPVGWEHSFINSTRHFINAYFAGEPPSLTGNQGREILRFALAAQESSQSGQAIKL